MPQGFSQQNNFELNKLVERSVRYCQKRSPEELDYLFDSILAFSPAKQKQVSNSLIEGIGEALKSDIETTIWFCSYLASEINTSNDTNKPYLPIANLCKVLIESGLIVFKDFVPATGCRIIITNNQKFLSLPKETQEYIQTYYESVEKLGKQFTVELNAILQELR